MNSSQVVYEERGHTAWIMMNRPEVLNALSREMFQELRLGLLKAEQSKNPLFIAITGAEGSFSAGLDIKQVGGFASRVEAKNFVFKLVKPFWDQFFQCNKPILSVVDGPAYGAGAEIALASDIVIASERSRFAFSGGRVGALCCISGVVGPLLMRGRKLDEMNLTGNSISAEEAKDTGLVNYVTSQVGLMEKAGSILDDLARVSPISNSSFKRIRKSALALRALPVAYRSCSQRSRVAILEKAQPRSSRKRTLSIEVTGPSRVRW